MFFWLFHTVQAVVGVLGTWVALCRARSWECWWQGGLLLCGMSTLRAGTCHQCVYIGFEALRFAEVSP